uniref:Uncharacterized protein n=1 Tax=Bursaphelenchus xylophilus TaxID=6326 RepID=A0A1I7RHB3_BURXY
MAMPKTLVIKKYGATTIMDHNFRREEGKTEITGTGGKKTVKCTLLQLVVRVEAGLAQQELTLERQELPFLLLVGVMVMMVVPGTGGAGRRAGAASTARLIGSAQRIHDVVEKGMSPLKRRAPLKQEFPALNLSAAKLPRGPFFQGP